MIFQNVLHWFSLLAICGSFKITVFQPKMTTLNPSKDDQLRALQIAAETAARNNSDILILPELYLSGYNLAARKIAEVSGGDSFMKVQSIATNSRISILFTYPELEIASGNIYDSAALIYRDGSVLAEYRKVNLATGEDSVYTSGNRFAPVVELDGVRVGILICFDIFLPEPARTLALRRAQIILVPTANGYPDGINDITDKVVPTRALENNAHVVYVNWVQDSFKDPFVTFHGQTTVASSGGALLFKASATEAVIADIYLNTTDLGSSTAIGRPSPNYEDGLCDAVSS